MTFCYKLTLKYLKQTFNSDSGIFAKGCFENENESGVFRQILHLINKTEIGYCIALLHPAALTKFDPNTALAYIILSK